jgi:hypothetical protein
MTGRVLPTLLEARVLWYFVQTMTYLVRVDSLELRAVCSGGHVWYGCVGGNASCRVRFGVCMM